jgi:penicillin-binding protein 1A
MGHAAQGGRIAAPIFKQFAQKAFAGMPPVPFVAPNGIRWVRVERGSGRRVFGTFPTREDPKSPVIWEAFQPQTEPRRSFRGRDENNSPRASAASPRQAKAPRPVRRARPAAPARAAQAPARPAAPQPTAPLPT